MKYCLILIATILSNLAISQTPCENGYAGDYPCNNVELLSLVEPSALGSEFNSLWTNDVWGWTDPDTKREYALVGMPNGTSFVDVTDPLNPSVIGILPEHGQNSSTLWRDIKVFNNYAFIVAEDNTHGLQIFDLTRLRGAARNRFETFTEDAHYGRFGRAHNLFINEETGYAYVVGIRAQGGLQDQICTSAGLHIIDVNNPLAPQYAGCFALAEPDAYSHDTQCVVYNGPDEEHQGKQICFSSNEESVQVIDVTDPANASLISISYYEGAVYAHQGWLTEDHAYFISNDELDESNLSNNTRTLMWDMTDLDNPEYIDSYYGVTQAIDHNLYIRDKYLYQSNYNHGLRILNVDMVSEGKMYEIGFFDTYPENDNTEYNGTWSNYPYFESGTIIVTDQVRGLFVLKANLPFYMANETATINGCEGTEMEFEVFSDNKNVSYQWQVDTLDGYENLTNNEFFSGVNSSVLDVTSLPLWLEEGSVRCKGESEGTIVYSGPVYFDRIDPLPIPNFVVQLRGLTIKVDNTARYGTHYEWDFGDGSEITTSPIPTHTYSQEGTYTVTQTVFNDCGVQSTSQTINIISTDSRNLTSLQAFPNPTNDIFTIDLPESAGNHKFLLVDVTGKSTTLSPEIIDENRITFDLKDFQKGIYYIKVLGADHHYLSRVVIN